MDLLDLNTIPEIVVNEFENRLFNIVYLDVIRKRYCSRSSNRLGQAIGRSPRSVERYLVNLKDQKIILTENNSIVANNKYNGSLRKIYLHPEFIKRIDLDPKEFTYYPRKVENY